MNKTELRAYIQSLGYTTEALAEKLGMAKVNVAQYLNDESIAFGKKVANRFSVIGVNPEWLLGVDDKMLLDGYEFKPIKYDQENYIDALTSFFKIHKLRSGAIAKSLGISRQSWVNYMARKYDMSVKVINKLNQIYGINKKWLASKGKEGEMFDPGVEVAKNFSVGVVDVNHGESVVGEKNIAKIQPKESSYIEENKRLKQLLEDKNKTINSLKKEVDEWIQRFEKEQSILADFIRKYNK